MNGWVCVSIGGLISEEVDRGWEREICMYVCICNMYICPRISTVSYSLPHFPTLTLSPLSPP